MIDNEKVCVSLYVNVCVCVNELIFLWYIIGKLGLEKDILNARETGEQ